MFRFQKTKPNMIKRLFDIVLAFLGLVFLSSLLILIAVLIKIDSEGRIFYKGIRVGKNGKLFKIFKFRTMVPNAENIGGSSTADKDPRITRVGKFLRKYKLDELPQLINVLRGEMSIVGPRPQVEEYVSLYNKDEKAILIVRPGMTDYASVKFINLNEILGSEDADRIYKEKVEPEKNELRLKYIRDKSLWVDVRIIIKTFIGLLKIVFLRKK